MKKEWTYSKRFEAHYGTKGQIVIIPDEVANDQRKWVQDGNKPFPAYVKGQGRKVRAKLDPDAYGLMTPGTGDPVVISA